jgi:hypothetical protein
MLTFGRPAGWARDEVLVWKEGRSRFVPLPVESHRTLFQERGFGDLTRMYVDLQVFDDHFPFVDDIRIDAPNATFYAGSQSSWGAARSRADVRQILWPSRLLMAKSVARKRKLELRESAPGRAARIALTSLGDISYLGYLLHAPYSRCWRGWQRGRALAGTNKDFEAKGMSRSQLRQLALLPTNFRRSPLAILREPWGIMKKQQSFGYSGLKKQIDHQGVPTAMSDMPGQTVDSRGCFYSAHMNGRRYPALRR